MRGFVGALFVSVAVLVCCHATPTPDHEAPEHDSEINDREDLGEILRYLVAYESQRTNNLGGTTLLGRNLNNGLGGSSLLGRNLDGLGGNSLLGRSLDNLGGSSLLGRNTAGIGGSSLLGRNLDTLGGSSLLGRDIYYHPKLKRYLDSLGGGNFVRNLDSIGGGNFVRNLDSLGGGNLVKRNLDQLGGPNFVKRTLDSLGGGNFVRNLDSLGGGNFVRQLDPLGGGGKTRNLDPLGGGHLVRQVRDTRGWSPFLLARQFDYNGGFGGKRDAVWPFGPSPSEFGAGYYAVGLPKRNFDEIDRSGLDNFVRKRNFDEIDQTSMPFPYSKRFAHNYPLNWREFLPSYEQKDKRGTMLSPGGNFDEIDNSPLNTFTYGAIGRLRRTDN